MKKFDFLSKFDRYQTDYCNYMYNPEYSVSEEPVYEFTEKDVYSVKFFKREKVFEIQVKTETYSYELVMDDINKIKMLHLKYKDITIKVARTIKAIKDKFGKFYECNHLRFSYNDGRNSTQIESALMDEISIARLIDAFIIVNSHNGDYRDPMVCMAYNLKFD